jgi:hypothetical protein
VEWTPRSEHLDAGSSSLPEEQIRHFSDEALQHVNHSKIGSATVPENSGYASQSRAEDSIIVTEQAKHDTLAAESIPDTLEDDIESVFSDNVDIQSTSSAGTNLPAHEGRLHLAQILAAHPGLAPLCKRAIGRMERNRFIQTTRKFLKPYYRNLLREASNERERASIQLLKSRRGRQMIGTSIAKFLEDDMEEEEDIKNRANLPVLVERRAEYLNTWLSQTPHGEQPGDVSEPHRSWREFHEECSNEDGNSSIASSEVLALPHLSEMENLFRDSKPFRLLTNEFRKMLLPRQVRQVLDTVPKSQIWLSRQQNNCLTNQIKSSVEDYTQLEWNWWPLEPRMRTLRDTEMRMFWACVSNKLVFENLKEVRHYF